jgi:predicted DNA-binding ArsR family transcriptional regulator
VHQVLVAAPDRVAMARAIKDTYGSRKMDRALQLLRKAGLLAYDPPSREWRRTAAGDKAQATA